MLWLMDEIKHWHVGEIIVLTILCRIADKVLIWFLLEHPPSVMTTEFWLLPIRVLILLIWGTIVWSILIGTFYFDKTGRTLREDQRNHKLSVWELYNFYKDADPYRMDTKKLPIKRWQDANGIILGKVGNRLIYRDIAEGRGEGANFLVLGLPGTGKTAGIFIPTFLQFSSFGSVFCVDMKGDILNAVRSSCKKLKVFDPFNPQGESCHYDPLASMRKMDEYKRSLFWERTALVLCPDDGSTDGAFFTQTARNMLCGIAIFLYEGNQDITLPEIADEIITGNVLKWLDTIKESDCISAKRFTDSLIGSSEKNLSGCWGELGKKMRPYAAGLLAEVLKPSDDMITPKVLDDGWSIMLEIRENDLKIMSPLISLITQDFLMNGFMQRPDLSEDDSQRPILFLLDEYAAFDIDILEPLATARSKKITIMCGVQSIGQLQSRYKDDFRTIVDTMRYITILSAQDPESRKWCQELIGKRKTLIQTYSESESVGQYGIKTQTGNGNIAEAESEEYIFKEEDFANLGKDKLVIYADGKYIKAEKCFWFK